MHMTCKSCKHGFCWLCMGDASTHRTGGGHFDPCSSYEEASKKPGMALGPGHEQKETREREIMRLEHFRTRFVEHQNSIKFAERTLEQMHTFIENLAGSNVLFKPQDFQFLIDICKLVIAARRSLSYAYPVRYYLSGNNR